MYVHTQGYQVRYRLDSGGNGSMPPMHMEETCHGNGSSFLSPGVQVNYYVHTDFAGFEQLVDVLRRIEINVKKRMHYVDKAQGLEIDIQPGLQVLNGKRPFIMYAIAIVDV